MTVLLSKRSLNATALGREEKRMKIELRVETTIKISEDLDGSLERNTTGGLLFTQVGDLAATPKY
jgi:hypothetical protein